MLYCNGCMRPIADEDAVKVAFGGVATVDEYVCPQCGEELENLPEDSGE